MDCYKNAKETQDEKFELNGKGKGYYSIYALLMYNSNKLSYLYMGIVSIIFSSLKRKQES